MKRGAPVTPRKLAVAIVFACAVPVASACTLLVKFHDEPDTDATEGGADEAAPRVDVFQPVVDSGPADAGPVVDPVCSQKADGFNYDTNDPHARCCNQQRVKVDTNDNCGVCGFRCVDNQTCTAKAGYYYCKGCAFDGSRVDSRCAQSTGCCSTSFDSEGLCAASTCISGSAECNNPFCISHGAQCFTPSGSSFVCAYQ